MEGYLLTRAEIEQREGLEKTHFLNADARRNNKSLGDWTGLTGFGFHLIEVPPGKFSTEYHQHHFEDECVYILSGEAEVTLGDDTFTATDGDFIGYRAGGPGHCMRNTGTEPLRCIVVGERRAHDVVDYPRHNKRLFRNGEMAWNLVDTTAIDTPQAGKKT